MFTFLLALIAVGVGLTLWSAQRRWRAGRRLAAGRRAALGVAGLPLLFGTLLAGSNLYTYHALTREIAVGEIHFTRLGEQRYTAEFKPRDAPAQRFELNGDEWQLDARVIKWLGVGTLFGLDPLYRLDRLSGRYLDPAQARAHAPSLYALGKDAGIDIWKLARQYPLGLVDASYGSGVFLPMRDGARYRVSMTASGLIARRIDPEGG